MRVLIPVLVILSVASCSPPSQRCESQFDCFGSEVCVDGQCVTQIVVTEDATSPDNLQDTGDGDADDTSAVDADPNNETSDIGRGDVPDPPDMTAADAGACSSACGEDEVCAGFGACVAASTVTVWTLDDVEVARHLSAEALYYVGQDSLWISIPYWGRNLTITVEDVTSASPLSATCADFQDDGYSLSLITTDNGWAELDALPARWSGLIATDSSCPGGLVDGDTLQRWDLELTTITPTSAVGAVDVEIEGAGPRAGETLRITSTFDVVPEQM